MLTIRIGALLRSARRHRGLTRADLAREGGVSLRLVAELEQGKRPNVSLESALTLLRAAGVTVLARAPNGEAVEIRDPAVAALERAERSAERRRTWTGRRVSLHAAGDPPPPARSKAARLAAVGVVSRQAGAVATERKPRRRVATRVPPGR